MNYDIHCCQLHSRVYSTRTKEQYTLMEKFNKTPGAIIDYLNSKTSCFSPTDLELLIKTFPEVKVSENLIKFNNEKYRQYTEMEMADYHSQLADEQAEYNDSLYKEANEAFYREFNGDYHDDML